MGEKYENVAILCLCLRQQMELIQSKTEGRNYSCCLPPCLVLTAAFILLPSEIFSRFKSCADKNKQKKTLKCSTFKEVFPCSYCSTTVFCLVVRCKNPLSLYDGRGGRDSSDETWGPAALKPGPRVWAWVKRNGGGGEGMGRGVINYGCTLAELVQNGIKHVDERSWV